MGVIQRQSIKYTIISYLGVVIAFFATMFIYKQDEDIYGFAQFILGTGYFLLPLVSLGLYNAIIKFFPSHSENKRKYLNSFLLMFLGTVLIFLLIYTMFSGYFHDFLQVVKVDPERLIEQYDYYIIALAIVLALNLLLYNQSSNLLRISIPELINNVGFKLCLPLIVYAAVAGWIAKEDLPLYILISHIILAVLIFIYLWSLGAIGLTQGIVKDIRANSKETVQSFSLYSSLNTMGGMMAFRIDVIMITTILGTTATGIYTMMIFLTSVVDIPRRAIIKISTPIISQAWKDKDLKELSYLYKSTSINLMIPGILIAGALWICLPLLDVIAVGEDIFFEWRFIFLLIVLGKLVDMSLSVNSQLIEFSSWYKYNLLFLIFLAVLNVGLNYYFIQSYGLIGAAGATALSYLLFNVIKMMFIRSTMKMSPFGKENLYLLLIVAVIFLLLLFVIPSIENVWINTIVQLSFFTLSYVGAVFYFDLSKELKDLVTTFLNAKL